MADYDVLVVGGGTSGAVAAIQAGRLGASVLLVEMAGQLGGTITNGHVSAPALGRDNTRGYLVSF